MSDESRRKRSIRRSAERAFGDPEREAELERQGISLGESEVLTGEDLLAFLAEAGGEAPPPARGATAAVAGLACLVALAVYLWPALLADAVRWETVPYAQRLGRAGMDRWPGYLWPAVLVGLLGMAALPVIVPAAHRTSSLLGGAARAAALLLVVIALLLLAWLCLTPLSTP